MKHEPTASIFDSDAYGVNTDLPVTAYEMIDECLKPADEKRITKEINEFIEELASEHFNTSEWNDEHWDAWMDKFKELM